MLRKSLLILSLVVALVASAITMDLPLPVRNYRTFSQSVLEAPKVTDPSAELKQLAKEYKDKLKAKKVDIITLADGKTYLLATNKKKQVALYTADGVNVGSRFPEWTDELSIVKIKGDDRHYYFEGVATMTEPRNWTYNFLNNDEGQYVTSDFTALIALEIDGDVYVHEFGDKYYHLRGAYPKKDLGSALSEHPFYYVSASDAEVATDTVNGASITLPTIPHKAYFGTIGGVRAYIDGSQGTTSKHSDHNVTFRNAGYDITAFKEPKITSTLTTAIVNGEERTGTLLSVNPPERNDFMNLTLYAPDGRMMLTNCQTLDFSEPDSILYYKTKDTLYRRLTGAISLADTTLQVPPLFANVQRAINAEGNGVWLVARKAFAPLEIYDPDADYSNISYRSKIEEDYNNGNYFSVNNALRHSTQPLTYDDLLLALSAYTIDVTEHMSPVERIVAQYRSGIEPEGINDERSMTNLHLQLLKDVYPLYKLDDYCDRLIAEAPAGDKDLANRIVEEAKKTYREASHLNNIELDNARNDYNELMAQRRLDKAKADALAAQRAQEAAVREAQLRAERQQAVTLAFINGLGNLLQSTMSGSHKGKSGGGKASSFGGKASSPSVGGSSGSSGAVDNSGRKAFLKNQIIEWKNKAKKAEASYQQALSGGDDSWQKKNVIDSKRRSVDEALEMVRQYEAELNSLK